MSCNHRARAVQIIQQLKNCKHFISVISRHANLFKFGLLNDTITTNHLLNSYVRSRRIEYAHQLFDEMPEPNVVSWTSLISGYVNMGRPQFALWLYTKMLESEVSPNGFTIATVINSCSILADIKTGKMVHAHVQIMGLQGNLVVCSSLVDMYGKCNDVDGARMVFDSMGCRNVVSWTTMIASCAQNGKGYEALEFFREFSGYMTERPNHFMLTSVINACASLGRLVSGKVTHGAVIRGGYELNDVVASALVDMYAKCGCFLCSEKVFKRTRNPSVIQYTAMIVGAAKYGRGKQSLKLFEEMTGRKVMPNDVTFVGILHACSHSGLVDEGLGVLNSMHEKHGVMPDTRHYTCVVDMLSRAGRLDEAYKLARSIRASPNEGALLWGTVLSSSRLQGRVDIAVEASKWLIESNQQVAGAYVTLSNTYTLAGEWEKAHSLRAEMDLVGVHKEPGCSWIEIKDSIYVFYAGDLSCERRDEVISLLRELERRMMERGYVGGSTGLVSVDVEQEVKEKIVGLHSERVALAFGLISIPKGVTIRVMKNLRICSDCHEAFKLISKIVERDFVVRDVNRFHHFKDGSCTCKDFW